MSKAASSQTILPELPGHVVSYLSAGALGLIITIGDDGYPTDAFTWIVAKDSKRVRFGAYEGSKSLANLNRTGRVAVQIIGPDNLVFLIKGDARRIKGKIDTFPMQMGVELWEMNVMGAKDQSWPGAAPAPMAVQWSGDERKEMIRAEQAVIAEMLEAAA